MGSLQQIFVGAVCVGGAFVMGHYLNHPSNLNPPFEKDSAASALPDASGRVAQKEKTALLPNFRTQSSLGMEFEKQADLPPPSQLDAPIGQATVQSHGQSHGSPDSSGTGPAEQELDIEVPDFSALAAQFKGTLLELPSLDSAPAASGPETATQLDSTASRRLPNSSLPPNVSNHASILNSGLADQGHPSNGQDRNLVSAQADNGVLIPNFKTSINPLEDLEQNTIQAAETPALLSTETAFRAEDFAPRLRSDLRSDAGSSISTGDPNPPLTEINPIGSGLPGSGLPGSGLPGSGLPASSVNVDHGYSVLDRAATPTQPQPQTQPQTQSQTQAQPQAGFHSAHPHAVVSFNDPFLTQSSPAHTAETWPMENGLNNPVLPAGLSEPESSAGSNQWLPRDRNPAAPVTSETRLTQRQDTVTTSNASNSNRAVPFGLNAGERQRLTQLSRNDGVASTGNETRFETYQTRAGDTLQAISTKYYGTPDYYLDIYLANRNQLRNPGTVPAGIALRIPVYE